MTDQVEVTNADKVLFPRDGITKGDLVGYYRQVADTMVPHLRGRPLSLQRFPDGVDQQGFFQQEVSGHFPAWVGRATVPRKGGGTVEHPVCDDPDTLPYLANLGAVTLHTWTSRVPRLERPDRVVFDLDRQTTARCGWCATSPGACATCWRSWAWCRSCRPPGPRASTW